MELRTLRDSDMERFWELDSDSFHAAEDKREPFLRWHDPADFMGIFDGERLVAVAGAFRFGQFFGGRSVPMGGLTGVSVAPDRRGDARRVCGAVVEMMRERGDAISSLLPAATHLYRSLGWEVAGSHVVRAISPRFLAELPRPEAGGVRPGGAKDIGALRAC